MDAARTGREGSGKARGESEALSRVGPAPWLRQLLWVAVWLLVLIGVAVVFRRTYQLLSPPRVGNAPFGQDLDAGFTANRALTLVHILPGLFFVLLMPLQFRRNFRTHHPRWHRWIGRVALGCGMVVGVSALGMSSRMSIGGPTETAATTTFGLLFLYALLRTYLHARRGEFTVHREWAIRAFATGLSVAAIRPIIGIFFATSRFTGLTPHDFFGIGFWIGFTLQLLVAQAWIDATRYEQGGSGTADRRQPVTG